MGNSLSELCGCNQKDPKTEINMSLSQNQKNNFSSPITNLKTNVKFNPFANYKLSTYGRKQNLYDLNLSQDLRVKLLNEQNSLILNNKLSTKISPNKSKIKYNNNNKKINFSYNCTSTINTINSLNSINTYSNNSVSSKLNQLINARGNNEIYIGEKKGNMKNGLGIQIWNKDTFYFGTFKDDKVNGIGKFISGNSKYKGEFKNDNSNGFGIYKNNKLTYEGYWSHDLQNNYGIEKWEDGSIYKGEYYKGRKKGIGTYIWKNGTKYEGEFLDNNFHGYGIYYYKEKKYYSGQWENNEKSGLGEIISKKKAFIGFFSNDKKNGFGISFWKNRNKCFIGFWKNGIKIGPAKIINDNKIIYGILDKEGNIKKIKEENDFNQILTERGVIKYKKFFDLSFENLSNMIYENYFNDALQ